MAQCFPFLLSGISKKARWVLAYVCGLQGPQQGHYEGQISNLSD